jgi:hypothetical protein
MYELRRIVDTNEQAGLSMEREPVQDFQVLQLIEMTGKSPS